MESYEEERERQVRENAEFLASLGLEKLNVKPAPKKRVKAKNEDEDSYAPKREFNTRKRSKPISYFDDEYTYTARSYSKKKKKSSTGGLGIRRANPGRRIVGGRVYDSEKGHTCHQCRQKTMDNKIACANNHCTLMMDYKCLLNRYNEDANELDHDTWTCPKCRGICNCSFCMKKRGRAPTGQLATFIKLNGVEAAKQAIGAKKISSNVLYPPAPVRHARSFEGIDMNLSDYESGSDDDAAVNGSKPARTPTRSSRRLASSDVLQKIANSVRESEDDLEWYGWSSCPREFDCVVLVEYG